MGLSEEIRRKLIATFQAEQREHLQKITQGLLMLEKSGHGRDRQAVLEEIFREAHSLKGSARAVNRYRRRHRTSSACCSGSAPPPRCGWPARSTRWQTWR